MIADSDSGQVSWHTGPGFTLPWTLCCFDPSSWSVWLWRKDQRVPPGRGGEGRCCCCCRCRLSLYCRDPRSGLPPLSSEFRRVFTAKWLGPGRHGWISESPQLSFEVCSCCFFQKPCGARAGCKLPDFTTKKLWVERDKRGHPQHHDVWRLTATFVPTWRFLM